MFLELVLFFTFKSLSLALEQMQEDEPWTVPFSRSSAISEAEWLDWPTTSHSETPLLSLSLDDFFWTGSGEGPSPPDPPAPPRPVPSVSPATVTTTLLATLYLETEASPLRPQEEEERTDSTGGVFGGWSDRRYWLVTVVRGGRPRALRPTLASLYRRAFNRQQERHLGIVRPPGVSVSTRKKHETALYEDSIDESVERVDLAPLHTRDSRAENVDLAPLHTRDSRAENASRYERSPSLWHGGKDLHDETQPDTITRLFVTADTSTEGHEKDYDDDDGVSETDELFNASFLMKRDVDGDLPPSIDVFIHNITDVVLDLGVVDVRVVYSVVAGGRAVPAVTAAEDLALLSDEEVAKALGYPFTTKAEPYLHAEPLSDEVSGASVGAGALGRDGSLWLWAVCAALIIALLLLVVLFVCWKCRSKKSTPTHSLTHILHPPILKNELGFNSPKKDVKKPTALKFLTEKTDRGISSSSTVKMAHRPSSDDSTSITSSVSEDVSDTAKSQRKLFISEDVRQRIPTNQRLSNQGRCRKLRSKKVGALESDSDLSTSSLSGKMSEDSFDGKVRKPKGVISPTSYLSMPSIKSFPRGNTVEPLSRVLEPISVRHLDVDSPVHKSQQPSSKKPTEKDETDRKTSPVKKADRPDNESKFGESLGNLVRLGTLTRDPGVVGPLVWDLHKQKMVQMKDQSRNESDKLGEEIRKCVSTVEVERSSSHAQRHRFTELVEDAFSLFGSGHSTPAKSHSAVTNAHRRTSYPHFTPQRGAINTDMYTEATNRDVQMPAAVKNRTNEPLLRPTSHSHTTRAPSASLTGTRRVTICEDNSAAGPSPLSAMRRTSEGGAVSASLSIVTSDSRLPPTDPALPLISAITAELNSLK